MLPRQTLGGAREIELDHLGRAGADEKQHLDVGTPLQQARDHPIEFVIGVRQAGEIALVDDRGGEARLGEDHDAGGGLDQVRAGARADHQEECVLDLAMQPDDAGQAAEHLALAAFAQNRQSIGFGAAAVDLRDVRARVHGTLPTISEVSSG